MTPFDPSATKSDSRDEALLQLLSVLKAEAYRFTCITPASHALILACSVEGAPTHRDIFGWNRPFVPHQVESRILELMQRADILRRVDGALRSDVRVSSLDEDLFLHSGFPTEAVDAVFFGPDTYRFARFIEEELGTLKPGAQVVDMGAGSGAGGLRCARLSPDAEVTLVDVNDSALALAKLNAAAAGISVRLLKQDRLPPCADLVLANPPYMIDAAGRAYRDGGDLLGGAIALDWVRQALATMAPGGRMLLYTGVAVVDGRSPAIEAIAAACADQGAGFRWREIDCDIFGEELGTPAYSGVERIAAVGCVVSAPLRPS